MAKIQKPISMLIYIITIMLIIELFAETLPASIITWAGIVVALICIALVYKNQSHLAVILSCIAATGSFLFQGVTVFCIPCTVIACLFCIQIFILEGPIWLLSIALLSGVFMFVIAEEPIQDKNLLYISENAATITAVNSNAVAVGNVSNADGLITKTEQEQAANDLRQIGLVVVTLLIIVATFRFIAD